LRPARIALNVLFALANGLCGCRGSPATQGVDCAQDGRCPDGLQCFPDWRCYDPGAHPDCSPACYGLEPLCDHSTLRCVECVSDADCPAGRICAAPNRRCVPGCSAEHPACASAAETCDPILGVCRGCGSDGDCTDPASPHCDPETERCVPCLPDRDDCPSGQYCAGAHGAYDCTAGCRSVVDCGGVLPACCNHRCVDTSSDSNDCGACGVPCRGGRLCCSGQCIDVSTDLDNCGGCGRSCAPANATDIQCTASQCGYAGCESYFADCDGDRANGCEVNLTHDPANCYGCGIACTALPHATPGCTVAGCGLGACLAGWADCNHVVHDGCEYDTTGFANDPLNCGNCGNACAAGQSCVNGNCN
jgi:Cys-rich repeat protein